jgi:cell division protein FtsW (lipid II flippase)
MPWVRDAAVGRQDVRALGRTVFGIAVGLTAFGLVMIYSWTAVKFADRRPSFSPDAILRKQVIWAFIALTVGLVVSRIPLAWMRRNVVGLMGVLLALLAATLVPGVGVVRNNSRRCTSPTASRGARRTPSRSARRGRPSWRPWASPSA